MQRASDEAVACGRQREPGELARGSQDMTHTVAIVVKKDALVLGGFAQLMAEFLRVLKCWIKVLGKGQKG